MMRRLFEYANQRVGPFAVQEAFGDVGARLYLQVDDDVLAINGMASIQMVAAGRMRITNEQTGYSRELRPGEGSYEIERTRGLLRYEALEANSRFVCVAPASPGQRIYHRKVWMRFGTTTPAERRNSLLMLGEGEVRIGRKFAAAPALVWIKRGGEEVFASAAASFIEFWLERATDV